MRTPKLLAPNHSVCALCTLLAAGVLASLTGCGSGAKGRQATSADVSRATVRVSFTWPAETVQEPVQSDASHSRFFPRRARSLRVRVLQFDPHNQDPDAVPNVIREEVRDRPANPTTAPELIIFADVPNDPGRIELQADAFDAAAAAGTRMAGTRVQAKLNGEKTSVTMNTEVRSLGVVAPRRLQVGQARSLNVVAYNGVNQTGAVVLLDSTEIHVKTPDTGELDAQVTPGSLAVRVTGRKASNKGIEITHEGLNPFSVPVPVDPLLSIVNVRVGNETVTPVTQTLVTDAAGNPVESGVGEATKIVAEIGQRRLGDRMTFTVRADDGSGSASGIMLTRPTGSYDLTVTAPGGGRVTGDTVPDGASITLTPRRGSRSDQTPFKLAFKSGSTTQEMTLTLLPTVTTVRGPIGTNTGAAIGQSNPGRVLQGGRQLLRVFDDNVERQSIGDYRVRQKNGTAWEALAATASATTNVGSLFFTLDGDVTPFALRTGAKLYAPKDVESKTYEVYTIAAAVYDPMTAKTQVTVEQTVATLPKLPFVTVGVVPLAPTGKTPANVEELHFLAPLGSADGRPWLANQDRDFWLAFGTAPDSTSTPDAPEDPDSDPAKNPEAVLFLRIPGVTAAIGTGSDPFPIRQRDTSLGVTISGAERYGLKFQTPSAGTVAPSSFDITDRAGQADFDVNYQAAYILASESSESAAVIVLLLLDVTVETQYAAYATDAGLPDKVSYTFKRRLQYAQKNVTGVVQ